MGRAKSICVSILCLLILFALSGCRSTLSAPRSGDYFQSTRLAMNHWGRAGRDGWSGGRINCLAAGVMTLPTVVGPLYFWGVRPVVDTVDMAVVSPVMDIACLPYDYALNHWQRRIFVFTDPEGKPFPGVGAEVVETGLKFCSDEQGRIEFMAKDHVTLKVDTSRFYCRWPYEFGSDVSKEYVGGIRMPKEREREIQVMRKGRVSQREMLAVKVIMPGIDADYGFDCFEGDWVTPHGRGRETNLVFRASGNSEAQLRVDVRLPEEELSGFEMCPAGKYGEPLLRSWGCHTNSFKSMRLEKWDRRGPVAFRSHRRGSDEGQDVYGVIDGMQISRKDHFGACELEVRISVNVQRGNDGFEWEDHLTRNDAPAALKYPMEEVCANGLHVTGFLGRHLWVSLDARNRNNVPLFSTIWHNASCDKHRADGSLLIEPPRLDAKYRAAIDAGPEELSEALEKIVERPYLVRDWSDTLSRTYPKFNPETLRLLWTRLNGSTNEVDRACVVRVLSRPEMPGDILRAEFERACNAKDWRHARFIAGRKGAFSPDERRAIYHDPRYALFRYSIAMTMLSRQFDLKARDSLRKEVESLLAETDVEESAKLRRLHALLEERLPTEMPERWPNCP